MKDNEQETVHSFFYKNNFKRTIKAEINTENFLSKFGK